MPMPDMEQATPPASEPARPIPAPAPAAPEGIFSVDVEDWFHILDVPATPPIEAWDALPSRVEANFLRLLDLFDDWGARTTCFFLGWVGERYPRLVREADARGHEIASHGYDHRLVHEHSRDEFRADASRARRVLEDIAGAPVRGYRSAGFSVGDRTRWFVDCLIEAGYHYDSSIFPAAREHEGFRRPRRGAHILETGAGSLVELPVSVADVFGRPVCFFGGGYLRLFPYSIIRRMSRQVAREGRPVVFYIHPREIDPGHPRLPMNWRRRFKSYYNLDSTLGKVRNILAEFRLTTFHDYLARRGDDLPRIPFDAV